ncbi:MAG: anaerobic benzoate catabolism transcriptional regulator [Actinobacteria bacterium ADurb.Bin444]|nr:MAG: anaerobic benzoate catabolism transcriptional regulator [Actinobacteria bacterium ADurb.Bin444]
MADQEVSELRNRILGIMIRSTRDQARASRRDCAAVLGVSVSRFASYEDGTRAISLPELELLARYLEVPLGTFRATDSLNEDSKESRLPNPELFLPLRHRIVGTRLRQLRGEKEKTQADVAAILDCSTSTISDYEYGRRGIPVADLELICRGMGVTLDYFMDRDSEVGAWHNLHREFELLKQLPPEVRDFVLKPINQSYLELAMKLSKMPAGQLRVIAEGLLEITY